MPEPVIDRFPPESLVLHELAHLVPETPPDQYAALLADVRARGEIEEPLKRIPGTSPPVIIDGRTRRKAAIEAEIPFVPVQDAVLRGDSPVVYMLRVARLRRHLDADQLAALGAELHEQIEKEAAERKKAGAKKGGETAGRGREKAADSPGATPAPRQSTPAPTKPARAPRSAEIAAEKVGSTRRKVAAAVEVKKKAPEAFAEVKAGRKTLKAAVAEVKAKGPPKPAPAKKAEPAKLEPKNDKPGELSPCPFCGSNKVELGPVRISVYCKDCRACGPIPKDMPTQDRVVAAWNKRAEPGPTIVNLATPLASLLSVSESDKVAALKRWHPWATVETLLELCPAVKKSESYTSAVYEFLKKLPGLGNTAAYQIGDALVNSGHVTGAGPERSPKPAPKEPEASKRRAAK